MGGGTATSLAIMAVAALAACGPPRTRESEPPRGVQQSIEIILLVAPRVAIQLVQAAARDAGLTGGQVTVTGTATGSGQRSELVIGPYRVRQYPDAEVTLRALVVRAIGGGESARVVVSGTERTPDPRDATKTRTRPIIRSAGDDEASTWDEVERLAAAIRARRP